MYVHYCNPYCVYILSVNPSNLMCVCLSDLTAICQSLYSCLGQLTLDGTSMYVVCSRQFSLYHDASCLLIICGVVSSVAD